MTRDEALAKLDESATNIVRAFRELGIEACLTRELDGDEFRLICPQSVTVAVLLRRAADYLDGQAHRC